MFKNVHGLKENKSTCIFQFDYLFANVKMKQCLQGISRLRLHLKLHTTMLLSILKEYVRFFNMSETFV